MVGGGVGVTWACLLVCLLTALEPQMARLVIAVGRHVPPVFVEDCSGGGCGYGWRGLQWWLMWARLPRSAVVVDVDKAGEDGSGV